MKGKCLVRVAIPAALLPLIAYGIVGNPVVACHNRALKQAITSITEETIDFNAVVPFAWDTVYTFSPYASREEIERVIGFRSNSIKETVNEGMVQLLFVRGKSVVASVCGYADSLGYSVYFPDRIHAANNASFAVRRDGDIVRLTLLEQ